MRALCAMPLPCGSLLVSLSLLIHLTAMGRALGGDLSLSGALAKAKRQNLDVAASRDMITIEQHDYEAAKSRFYPKIDIEARYSHLNAPIELNLEPIRRSIIGSGQVAATSAGGAAAGATAANQLNQSIPAFNLKLQEQNYFNSAVTLNQPLYAGGRLVANETARGTELKVAQLESSDTVERIVVSAAQAYFSIKLAELNLRVRSEVLNGLKEHFSISKNLFKEGQITRINMLNAEVKVQEAEAAHIKASYELDLARKSLNSLVNEDVSQSRLTTELSINGQAGSAESIRRRASKGNKRILISKERASLLEQKQDSIEADHLPTIFAFGRYELYREYLTATEPEWVVGLGLKMNIYSGGETRETIASVIAEKTAVKKQIDSALQSVELGVDKAYSELASSEKQFRFLESAVTVATESVSLTEAAFKGGTARSIDVTDAYNSLAQTKLARLKCLSDYNFAYFQLKRLTGEAEAIKGD